MSRLAAALGLGALLSCAHAPAARGRSPELAALALTPLGSRADGPVALEGRVVLVSFFATWCFPCIAQLPLIQALRDELGPAGLTVVGVGLDLEGRTVLEPFMAYNRMTYPVVEADELLRSGKSAFGPITTLPAAALLDRSGRVVARWSGVASHAEFRALVERTVAR